MARRTIPQSGRALVMIVTGIFTAAGCSVEYPVLPSASPTAFESQPPVAATRLVPSIVVLAPLCGRLTDAACAQVLSAARSFAPDAFVDGSVIVADYACGPGVGCEAVFTALVAVGAPGLPLDGGSTRAFGVRGSSLPLQVWSESVEHLPEHIRALLVQALSGSP